MRSFATHLPPEIAAQVNPDHLRNEAAYWAARDGLLERYRGQWVGFADGEVIVSGRSPVAVLHAGEATGKHPFYICVGLEDVPSRIRRATFAYDLAYPGEPLPVVTVEFALAPGLPGSILDRVIPDTGADATVLPWADCQLLGLVADTGRLGLVGGVAGSSAVTLTFVVEARIDGRGYPCRVQADFDGGERLLGRDVLNQLDVLFRGPADEVVVNP